MAPAAEVREMAQAAEPGQPEPPKAEPVKSGPNVRLWALCVSRVVQFGVLIYAFVHIARQRDDWLKVVPEEASVLTISMAGFAGPVHVLVPVDCSLFRKNDLLMEHLHAAEASGSTAAARSLRGAGPEGIDEEVQGVTWNASHVTVERCGMTFAFLHPSTVQSYFAWTWLSGRDTAAELRATRCRLFWVMIAGCTLEALLGLVMIFVELSKGKEALTAYMLLDLPEQQKDPYETCSPVPKALARATSSLVDNAVGKLFVLQSQIGIFSLFFAFWKDDYFVASFVPGKALMVIYAFQVLLLVQGVRVIISRRRGADPVQRPGSEVMWLTVLAMVAFFVVFGIPMIFGYPWYVMEFLWNTILGFASAAQGTQIVDMGKKAMAFLVGAHVLELVLLFAADFAASLFGWAA